ncbi:MAG: AAA domain-containing protein, partial [Candidatus Izemoplasmatales bacterium]|nr:AAA domain-containing protein [Candidatus Izemoplasmatales bacterium]
PPEINRKLLKIYQVQGAYNYVDNSILQLMQSVDTISQNILLRYHYRCHKDIIEFSNKKYYHGKLKVPPKDWFDQQALFTIKVASPLQRTNERNCSIAEVDEIIKHIKTRKNRNIGIITPFRNQANLLKERVREENLENVDVGTVHTFQGDEKEIIYMSTAITRFSSQKTFDWLKNNEELINVATTRAKKEFVLVGDIDAIKDKSGEGNDIYDLVNHCESNGMKLIVPKGRFDLSLVKQMNTAAETELLETIQHILTFNTEFVIRTQVKVADLLPVIPNSILAEFSKKSTFDFVIYSKINNVEIPRLLVELDGKEHLTDIKRVIADEKKEDIVGANSIPLIRIPNCYTRRYVILKEVIMKLIA